MLVVAAPARAATCAGQDKAAVPGAEVQKSACLEDLTTAGTATSGHTDPTDYESLAARDTKNPAGIPGIQVDGYFPDTSTANTENGWAHDAQFVLRLPDDWNGKLVVTGAPGVRKQYAVDEIISDFVLGRGYAYAATDKGNSGQTFYAGQASPGDSVAEWHRRVTELTRAARATVAQVYGRAPARTYMTGISNGGYLTRFALEHHPELYDGGVDWEGTLLRAEGPNLFTYLPTVIANYPRWKAGDEAAHQAMLAAGLPAGSEFLWDYHEAVYWDLTQRSYREAFDPGYDGALTGGVPFCPSGLPACDADYDYAARPAAVRDAVRAVENTGDIGKPLITLHGTLDALLPIATDSDVYDRLVAAAGHDAIHRYYVIEGGNHVDGLYDTLGRSAAPHLALLPRGVRRDGGVGREGHRAAGRPDGPEAHLRRRGQHVRARVAAADPGPRSRRSARPHAPGATRRPEGARPRTPPPARHGRPCRRLPRPDRRAGGPAPRPGAGLRLPRHPARPAGSPRPRGFPRQRRAASAHPPRAHPQPGPAAGQPRRLTARVVTVFRWPACVEVTRRTSFAERCCFR